MLFLGFLLDATLLPGDQLGFRFQLRFAGQFRHCSWLSLVRERWRDICWHRCLRVHKIDDPELLEQLKVSPPMPSTSIFSRTDGVVAWPLSMQKESRRSENIEVNASHVGLGFNPLALYAVADRLSQEEGKWEKFHRVGWREWFYKDHARPSNQYF